VCLMYLKLHLGVGLHLFQHVHAAPAAIALEFVGTVSDMLQFLQHEARHDHLGVDDSRITNIGNPAVDNHVSIQDQPSSPLYLLRKLHVRDDEAELVLGLQEGGHQEIATDRRDQQAESQGELLVLYIRLDRHGEKSPQHQAEEQAEGNGRNRGNFLMLDEQIERDDAKADDQDNAQAEHGV